MTRRIRNIMLLAGLIAVAGGCDKTPPPSTNPDMPIKTSDTKTKKGRGAIEASFEDPPKK